MRFLPAFAVSAIFPLSFAVSAAGQPSARAASEHFLKDHNRIFVELGFAWRDSEICERIKGVTFSSVLI
jgi:hypothetical protein